MWETLVNATFPSAKTSEGVLLAIAYCRHRNLDIFKRPVHIVPMNTKRKTPDGKEAWVTIETVWPGISELRTTAFRTGKYAGCDPAAFGPDIDHSWEIKGRDSDDDGGHPNAPPSDKKATTPKEVNIFTMKFPEWCQITVYRIIEGQRVAFPGPRVYWLEAYATTSRFNDSPNEMWRDRARGQLEKCAEAAALRKAFPEELGGEYSIDESSRVIDRMVDVTPTDDAPTARPEKPSGSAAETKIGRAAREAAETKPAATIDHDPKTGEVIDQSADGEKTVGTP
jgi:phage recombination protein Bet